MTRTSAVQRPSRAASSARAVCSAQPMSHAQFQNARFSTGRLPVTPSRESFSASGRAAAPSTTRNVAQNQHFFSARGNTATASRSFDRGQDRGQSQVSNGNRQVGASTGNGREIARPGNTSSNSSSTRGNSNWGSAPRPGNSSGSLRRLAKAATVRWRLAEIFADAPAFIVGSNPR